jgi:hypothetical protein
VKIPARIVARLATRKAQPDELLAGQLRESQQYQIYDPEGVHYRWDFAYKDPASGKLWQYGCDALVTEPMSDEEFKERIFKPARARIASMLRSKCGIPAALAHQVWLPTARCMKVRYV